MKKLLLIAILLFSGCKSPNVVLYALSPNDIFSIPPGAWVEWNDMKDIKGPDGKKIKDFPGDRMQVEKWGWFISDRCLNEVHETKVK